ncbi:hypothetical protein V6N13_129247 [Hibiscus sabdariffa]|uniref:Uncharacterized protein n=1 Tax=Hibiscus sabdariffa TaxID=183260 RepID=A0ABR2SLJ5_9ROSI
MLEGKAVIGETDMLWTMQKVALILAAMLQTMQQVALDVAAQALDFFDVTKATEVECFIKMINTTLAEST